MTITKDTPLHREHYRLVKKKNKEETEELFAKAAKLHNVITSEDARVQRSLVILAECIYEENPKDYLNNTGRFYGGEHDHGIVSVATSTTTSEQSYIVAQLTGDKKIAVAFRGTDSMSDVFVDIQLLRKSGVDTEGSFHSGIYRRALLVPIEPFMELVNQGYSIYFTGHSLGGSVASLVASRILEFLSSEQQKRVKCVTFGAPLCADDIFQINMETKLLGDNFTHYIHRNDPVPLILSYLERIRTEYNAPPELIGAIKAMVSISFGKEISSFTDYLFSFISKDKEYQEKSAASRIFSIIQKYWKPNFLSKITDMLLPKFAPFGRTFIIEHTTVNNVAEYGINLVTNDDFWKLAVAPTSGEEFLRAMQAHKMTIYSSHLRYHFDYGYGVLASQLAKTTDVNLLTLFEDHNRVWTKCSNMKQIEANQFSVFITRFQNSTTAMLKLNLYGSHMSFFTHASFDGSKKVQAERSSSNNKASFVFRVTASHCTKDKYQVKVFSHFAEFTFEFKAPFNGEEEVSSKEKKVANLDVVQLFIAAQTYSLFIKERNPFLTISNNRAKTELEEGTDVSDAMSSSGMRKAEKSRIAMLKLLEELESIWPTESVKYPEAILDDKTNNREVDKKKIAALWNQAVVSIPNMKEHASDLEFSTDKVLFSTANRLFLKNQEWKTVDALTKSFSYALALQSTAFSTPIRVNSKIQAGILAGATLVMAGAAGAIILALGAVAAVAGTGLVGSGIIYEVFNNEMNFQYLDWVDKMAESLGIDASGAISIMSKEKMIYEKVGQLVKTTTEQDFEKDWKKHVPQNPLRDIVSSDVHIAVKALKTICLQHEMRLGLMEGASVGVIGASNIGKSTLSHLLFNCGELNNCGTDIRTKDISIYYRTQSFHLIDFPHIDSTEQSIQSVFAAAHSLLDAVVLVLESKYEGTTTDTESMIEMIDKMNVPYLLCFTRADELFTKRIMTKEEIEDRKLGILANLPKKERITKDTIMLASFNAQNIGDKALNEAGICHTGHVRNWIIDYVLKDQLKLPESDVAPLRKYTADRLVNGKLKGSKTQAKKKARLHPVFSDHVFKRLQKLGITLSKLERERIPTAEYGNIDVSYALSYLDDADKEDISYDRVTDDATSFSNMYIQLIERSGNECAFVAKNPQMVIIGENDDVENPVLLVTENKMEQPNEIVDFDVYIVKGNKEFGPYKFSQILDSLSETK